MFKFFVSRTLKILNNELSSFEELRSNIIEIRRAYDEEVRDRVIIPFAEKDTNGNPLMYNGSFNIKPDDELVKQKQNGENM